MFFKITNNIIFIVTFIVYFQSSFAYLLDLRVPTNTEYTYVAPKDTYLSMEQKENNLETLPNKLITIDNYAATIHTTSNTNMSMGVRGLGMDYAF